MRKRGRTDANQTEIANAFRDMGASVAFTSSLGGGFTDLVIGYRGVNVLVEIKDGSKIPSKQKLTKDEQKFMENWRGKYAVIRNVEEALALLVSIARNA